MHFKLKPRQHGRGAYADKPFRFVSIEKAKEAISQFYDESIYGKAYQPSEIPHFHTSISWSIEWSIAKSSLDSSLGRRPKAKSNEVLLWTMLCTEIKQLHTSEAKIK